MPARGCKACIVFVLRRVELVLLHPSDVQPQGTAAWLAPRPQLTRHHHIRLANSQARLDQSRDVAEHLTSQSRAQRAHATASASAPPAMPCVVCIKLREACTNAAFSATDMSGTLQQRSFEMLDRIFLH